MIKLIRQKGVYDRLMVRHESVHDSALSDLSGEYTSARPALVGHHQMQVCARRNFEDV